MLTDRQQLTAKRCWRKFALRSELQPALDRSCLLAVDRTAHENAVRVGQQEVDRLKEDIARMKRESQGVSNELTKMTRVSENLLQCAPATHELAS